MRELVVPNVDLNTETMSPAQFNAAPLEHLRLKIGEREVPLRSTQLRDGGGPLEHLLENSGRIAITLYVAENVTLAQTQ